MTTPPRPEAAKQPHIMSAVAQTLLSAALLERVREGTDGDPARKPLEDRLGAARTASRLTFELNGAEPSGGASV